MSSWNFLGKHAVTRPSNSRPCEYVVIGKNIVGYVEQNVGGDWTYFQFGKVEKGSTVAPEPVAVATSSTAHSAVKDALDANLPPV
jgi:hypothetical protein